MLKYENDKFTSIEPVDCLLIDFLLVYQFDRLEYRIIRIHAITNTDFLFPAYWQISTSTKMTYWSNWW